jgi:hypothetical protein
MVLYPRTVFGRNAVHAAGKLPGEGSGGGGAPVAITGALMVGLGFPAFQAVLRWLIAMFRTRSVLSLPFGTAGSVYTGTDSSSPSDPTANYLDVCVGAMQLALQGPIDRVKDPVAVSNRK